MESFHHPTNNVWECLVLHIWYCQFLNFNYATSGGRETLFSVFSGTCWSTYSWASLAFRKAMSLAVKEATKMDSIPKSRRFHRCSTYSLGPSSQISLHSDQIIPVGEWEGQAHFTVPLALVITGGHSGNRGANVNVNSSEVRLLLASSQGGHSFTGGLRSSKASDCGKNCHLCLCWGRNHLQKWGARSRPLVDS